MKKTNITFRNIASDFRKAFREGDLAADLRERVNSLKGENRKLKQEIKRLKTEMKRQSKV